MGKEIWEVRDSKSHCHSAFVLWRRVRDHDVRAGADAISALKSLSGFEGAGMEAGDMASHTAFGL